MTAWSSPDTSQTLLDLAERCEKATGPSSSLNKAILAALGYTWRGMDYWHTDNKRIWRGGSFLTELTECAMALVPEGAGISLSRYWIAKFETPVWSASVQTGGVPDNPRKVFDGCDTANLALAICAGALRARSPDVQGK